MRNFCTAKVPHTFFQQNDSIWAYNTFKNSTSHLMNDMVSFEELGPGQHILISASRMSGITIYMHQNVNHLNNPEMSKVRIRAIRNSEYM